MGGPNSSQPCGWTGPVLGTASLLSPLLLSSFCVFHCRVEGQLCLCDPHRLAQSLVPIRPQALPPHLHPYPLATLEAVVLCINKEGSQSVAGPCCLLAVLVPFCTCWTSNLTPLSRDSFLCETDVLMPLPWHDPSVVPGTWEGPMLNTVAVSCHR